MRFLVGSLPFEEAANALAGLYRRAALLDPGNPRILFDWGNALYRHAQELIRAQTRRAQAPSTARGERPHSSQLYTTDPYSDAADGAVEAIQLQFDACERYLQALCADASLGQARSNLCMAAAAAFEGLPRRLHGPQGALLAERAAELAQAVVDVWPYGDDADTGRVARAMLLSGVAPVKRLARAWTGASRSPSPSPTPSLSASMASVAVVQRAVGADSVIRSRSEQLYQRRRSRSDADAIGPPHPHRFPPNTSHDDLAARALGLADAAAARPTANPVSAEGDGAEGSSGAGRRRTSSFKRFGRQMVSMVRRKWRPSDAPPSPSSPLALEVSAQTDHTRRSNDNELPAAAALQRLLHDTLLLHRVSLPQSPPSAAASLVWRAEDAPPLQVEHVRRGPRLHGGRLRVLHLARSTAHQQEDDGSATWPWLLWETPQEGVHEDSLLVVPSHPLCVRTLYVLQLPGTCSVCQVRG